MRPDVCLAETQYGLLIKVLCFQTAISVYFNGVYIAFLARAYTGTKISLLSKASLPALGDPTVQWLLRSFFVGGKESET